jgi:hypothetical protein
MRPTLRGFLIGAAIALTLDLAILAATGQQSRLWILANLPSLPFVFLIAIFAWRDPTPPWWDPIQTAAMLLGSALFWGLLAAGIAWLITRRTTKRGFEMPITEPRRKP